MFGLRLALSVGVALLVWAAWKRHEGFQLGQQLSTELELCPGVATGPETRPGSWLDFAASLAKEITYADTQEDGYDVLFFGDSISEQWRGSMNNQRQEYLEPTHDTFTKAFNTSYHSDVMAISGDQVGHLWWRIQNGEFPKKRLPKAAVVLIGTNDVTAADCHQTEPASMDAVPGIVNRVTEVVGLMQRAAPRMHVLLLALLPRDALYSGMGHALWQWPNRMSVPLTAINLAFKDLADGSTFLHYVDCGSPFITESGLNATLLPDGLHPNPAGMALIAECLSPILDLIVLDGMGNATALATLPEPLRRRNLQSDTAGSVEGPAVNQSLLELVKQLIRKPWSPKLFGRRFRFEPPRPRPQVATSR